MLFTVAFGFQYVGFPFKGRMQGRGSYIYWEANGPATTISQYGFATQRRFADGDAWNRGASESCVIVWMAQERPYVIASTVQSSSWPFSARAWHSRPFLVSTNASHTSATPKYITWINLPLNFPQSFILITPKRILPFRLIAIPFIEVRTSVWAELPQCFGFVMRDIRVHSINEILRRGVTEWGYDNEVRKRIAPCGIERNVSRVVRRCVRRSDHMADKKRIRYWTLKAGVSAQC
jgi:hypothetical protein